MVIVELIILPIFDLFRRCCPAKEKNMPLTDKSTQHDGHHETVIIDDSSMVFINGSTTPRIGDTRHCGGVDISSGTANFG